MRWRSEKRENKSRPHTFFVLPLVDNNREVMTKSPSLRLHLTNAWQAKEDSENDLINENDIIQRPLTATLEKPEILDIRFIDKLDMSKMRKEFLTFTNLGINKAGNNRPMSTITISNSGKRDDNKSIIKKQTINKRTICSSRLSQLATPRQTNLINNTINHINNNQQTSTISDDSWEDDSSTSLPQSARKSVLRSRVIPPKRRLPRKPTNIIVTDNASGNDALNNTSNSSNKSKETTIGMVRKNKIPSIDKTTRSIKALPEPCTTCGRPDQPERFHSHPIASMQTSSGLVTRPNDVPVTKVPVKNTVQKPTAIKYKSKLTPQQPAGTNNLSSNSISGRISCGNVRSERKMSLPSQQLIHTPPGHNLATGGASGDARVRSPRGRPRTLTCYLCGREFGTASLPLHEPKCLERLQRENATLPVHLRRKLPIKPKSPLTQQDWNNFAWEASQQLLTPCHCGRTFHPDRLIVHQRSCKENASTAQVKSPSGIVSIKSMPPPSVQCKICGKLFGTKSIKYHEPQCIKKYQAEHGKLPPPPQLVSTTVKDIQLPSPNNARATTKDDESRDRPSSGKKPPMFPCYLCGRLFSVNSIYIHEPQCLKKWRAENDKLPRGKRRTEPLKPDIKFTPSGSVDFKGTFNRIWDNHLAELVTCKRCGRTFFPDRIVQHEEGCNAEPRRNAK